MSSSYPLDSCIWWSVSWDISGKIIESLICSTGIVWYERFSYSHTLKYNINHLNYYYCAKCWYFYCSCSRWSWSFSCDISPQNHWLRNMFDWWILSECVMTIVTTVQNRKEERIAPSRTFDHGDVNQNERMSMFSLEKTFWISSVIMSIIVFISTDFLFGFCLVAFHLKITDSLALWQGPRNIHILLLVLKMTRTPSSLTYIDSLRSLSSTTFDSFKLYLDFFLSSNVSLWLYFLFVLVFANFILVQVWKSSTLSLYHGFHVICIHDVTRKTRNLVQSYITLCIGLLFTFRSVQMSQLLQCNRRLSVRLVVIATYNRTSQSGCQNPVETRCNSRFCPVFVKLINWSVLDADMIHLNVTSIGSPGLRNVRGWWWLTVRWTDIERISLNTKSNRFAAITFTTLSPCNSNVDQVSASVACNVSEHSECFIICSYRVMSYRDWRTELQGIRLIEKLPGTVDHWRGSVRSYIRARGLNACPDSKSLTSFAKCLFGCPCGWGSILRMCLRVVFPVRFTILGQETSCKRKRDAVSHGGRSVSESQSLTMSKRCPGASVRKSWSNDDARRCRERVDESSLTSFFFQIDICIGADPCNYVEDSIARRSLEDDFDSAFFSVDVTATARSDSDNDANFWSFVRVFFIHFLWNIHDVQTSFEIVEILSSQLLSSHSMLTVSDSLRCTYWYCVCLVVDVGNLSIDFAGPGVLYARTLLLLTFDRSTSCHKRSARQRSGEMKWR